MSDAAWLCAGVVGHGGAVLQHWSRVGNPAIALLDYDQCGVVGTRKTEVKPQGVPDTLSRAGIMTASGRPNKAGSNPATGHLI